MILPSLNFAYWPNSTSLDKNIQIRAVSLTGTVVGSLTSGFLSDKFGRRAVIRLGPLLLLIGAICCAEASAGFNNQTMAFLGWILFSQFLIGFGAGVEFTLSAVTAAEYDPL
jgi:MFS transporter, PHS family, inorganic phosphate transporter